MGPTFGSLFTGIGGLDLGLGLAGWQCSWQVETDPACNWVLAKHWPEVRRYGDIKEIKPEQLEAVDLISAGWPCQDLSVAGKRGGLAGERSGLFFQAVRLIQGLQPQWLLLEQVPGLFSQNKGQDFAIVIQALTECGYGMAWRVLNSQYFGVAQRRRRVFIVGHFGGPCPPEILFESEGGKGHTTEGTNEGARVAASLTKRFGGRSNQWPPINEADNLIAAGFSAGQSSGAYGIAYTEEGTPPLRAGAGRTNQVPTVAYPVTTREGQRMEPTQDTYVFNWQSGGDVRLAINNECAGPLQANQVPAVAIPENQAREGLVWQATTPDTVRVEDDNGKVPALTKWMGTGGHNVPFVGVRRLTPTECERLQAFPDGWTEGQADSTRSRQLGNAVTVNVARWIGKRIAKAHRGGDETRGRD